MVPDNAAAYVEVLETGRHSDFKIICKDVVFKVHRIVICAASTMLEKACNGGFSEAKSGEIDLSEENKDILARVVLFMYTSDYDAAQAPTGITTQHDHPRDQTSSDSEVQKDSNGKAHPRSPAAASEEPPAKKAKTSETTDFASTTPVPLNAKFLERLDINARVYFCADLLGIQNLKVLAAERFMTDARKTFSHKSFAGPLRLVYENTTDHDVTLRIPVTLLCVKNHEWIANTVEVVSVLEAYECSAWEIQKLLSAEAKKEAQARSEQFCKTIARINTKMSDSCCASYWKTVRFVGNADALVTGYCGAINCPGRKV